ncbi:endocuticle structural glycoprotein SgAbd-5-like [Arctopsyche grandis]|uniref:endocuticle structural glycoprotein SgAbd-5-like n=1 Tax=Arctopsyche grandis TaxID=121162 RepID=UPI00406D8508
MKFAIVLICFAALVSAAPQNDVQLVSYENDNIGLGNYRFAYELTDGTKRQETGELKNAGTENEAISVQGSYTWISPDGTVWTVTFLADENGFQPKVESQGGPGGVGGGISGPLVASLLG